MKKKLVLLFTMVFLLFSVCVMAACGEDDDGNGNGNGNGTEEITYTITWQLDKATAAVTGYDAPPTSALSGTKISFTLTPDAGYVVDTVKRNGSTLLSATDGVYSFNLAANTTIAVTTSKEVTSLTVTPPTKLTYTVGDAVDRTGMVVTATYADETSEAVTAYTVAPTAFSVGDTEFTVTYGGKTETVALDGVVTATISLDPNGATFTDEVITMFSAIDSYFDNYSLDETTGIMTFTLSEVPADGIALPTAAKLEREGFTFFGWAPADGGAAVTVLTAQTASVTLTAGWGKENVKLETISIKLLYVDENGQPLAEQPAEPEEGAAQLPFLVLTGRFSTANEITLYLFEGNDNVELEGPRFSGEALSNFTLNFNLEDLAANVKAGPWMDIRFRTEEDVATGGRGQEILLGLGDGLVCNQGDRIDNFNGCTYMFQSWTNPDTNITYLKVQYTGALIEVPGTDEPEPAAE